MIVAFTLFVSGCGAANTEEKAKSAYKALNASADATDLVMSTVLSSWHFSIDEGEKYITDYDTGCIAFKRSVGIPDSVDVKEVINTVIKGSAYESPRLAGMVFKEASYCVVGGLKCIEKAGITESLEKTMKEAKDSIKEISDKNPNAKYLEGLKKYYSELESYKEFATNPTGSYIQAQSTAETYRANLKKCKNDLSFDLE